MNRIGTSIDELTERIAAIRASITPERQAEIDAAIAAERALEARRKVIAVGMPSIFERTPFDVAPARARRWAESAWDGSPRNLVVMGDSGAGKTEVACAILAESVAHLPNALCRFATFGDVLRSIRSTYDDVLRSEWQAIGQWAGFRILCIDDLGKEKPTADALEKMFTVLDARYRSGKPTLFTTQYQSPKELGHRLMESGGDKPTAQAIVRRVFGGGYYQAEVVRC